MKTPIHPILDWSCGAPPSRASSAAVAAENAVRLARVGGSLRARVLCSLSRMLAGCAVVAGGRSLFAAELPAWQRDNLQAWCIVPFDAKKRSPEERGEMLERIGLRRFPYDYRPEHIPTFDREVEVMKARGIAITAWWFPGKLDPTAHAILETIKRHRIRPALWVSGGGEPAKTPDGQSQRVAVEVARIRLIAEAARTLGCTVALYNHGGWFGDPENQLAVLGALEREGFKNVGLVYNFHHAHEHIRMFSMMWPRISRHVVAVNLSGLVENGDRLGKKIMYLGEGDQEAAMLQVIRASGWRGQLGILCHRTEVDAEDALRRNLAGYDKLVAQLQAAPAPAKSAAR